MDLKKIGWTCVLWIYLRQSETKTISCEHGNETSGSKNSRYFLSSYASTSLPSRTVPIVPVLYLSYLDTSQPETHEMLTFVYLGH
jgi:hypothetical protein